MRRIAITVVALRGAMPMVVTWTVLKKLIIAMYPTEVGTQDFRNVDPHQTFPIVRPWH